MGNREVQCPRCSNVDSDERSTICVLCHERGKVIVKVAADYFEHVGGEDSSDYDDAPTDGVEPCGFCYGSGEAGHKPEGTCLYCDGDGLVGPVRAELIRRELHREANPMEPRPETKDSATPKIRHSPEQPPEPLDPPVAARIVHSFNTFTTGHIGFVILSDDDDGPYRWYLVDPFAHNMAGAVAASGTCAGGLHGYHAMYSAIMGFASKLNPTKTPKTPETFDAGYVE